VVVVFRTFVLGASLGLAAMGCGRVGYGPTNEADSTSADTSVDVGGDADAGMDADTAPIDSTVPETGPADTSVVDDVPVAPLEVDVAACEASALVGVEYTCMPAVRDSGPGEVLSWSFGPAHTCTFLAIDETTGVATGSPGPGDAGECLVEVFVRSSAGLDAAARVTLTITASPVRSVDVGAYHTCALSVAGALRCWGFNGFGQLGYDDSASVADGTPGRSIADMGDVPVGGPVTEVSLGYFQTCALLASGGVRCWGDGSFARLGYSHGNEIGDGGVGGSIISNGDLPLGGDAVEVATGGVGGCARLVAGGVRCWGQNHGNGADAQINGGEIIAAGDVPIGADVVDIAAGYDHYCALTTTGSVRCWGQNWAGGLGYDHTNSVGEGMPGLAITDMGDVAVGGRVVQLSAGDATTCAVLDSGGLRCWGWNQYGQLGYGDTINVGDGTAGRSIIDMGDVPVGGPVRMAWAGEEHTCAVLRTGTVRCWGLNLEGQLGYDDTASVGDGTAGRSIIDMGDVAIGGTARTIVTTEWDTGFTCAHMTSGGIRCWGTNGNGNLGLDDRINVGDGTPGRSILDVTEVVPF